MDTINVIEFVDNVIINLRAFPNTPEGIAQAKETFTKVVRENYDGDDLDTKMPRFIEMGTFSSDNYDAFLVVSNK